MKRYTIEFEQSHKQWVIIDKENPDDSLGYFYAKPEARKVADMLNERIDLFAMLVELVETVTLCRDCDWQVLNREYVELLTNLEHKAKAIINTVYRGARRNRSHLKGYPHR